MDNKVTGVIESREVKDIPGKGRYAGQTSQKIALKVGGVNYSTFSNAVPADVAERLGQLKAGDEVEITFRETPGKDSFGREITYHNILDAIKVDRVSPPAQPTGQGKQADQNRDKMMLKSYSKDAANTILPHVLLLTPLGSSTDVVNAWIGVYDEIYNHLAGE